MGETQSLTFDGNVEKTAYQMDGNLSGVMPESWDGHGRMKIVEEVEGEARAFAKLLFDKISEKHPEADSEWLAEKVINKANEKYE